MDTGDTAIKVEHISKSFKLPHEKHNSLKSLFVHLFRRNKRYEVQKALQDVSFSIKKGEFFGVVGRNGSGKSTLLKLLAGIYTSDKGQIEVNGTLIPFIELGVGFNKELTGRENVYLNGALLGFNRSQISVMYGDIVKFAELERFMDQKLKNYSSGMQVRLAFSIAIRAQSDILVLDEVLAVGDEAFQQKCISVFEQYKANKQTIILVTHNMEMVERFCSRAMLITDGVIAKIGDPEVVADMYSDLNKEDYLKSKRQKKYTENIKLSILNAETKKPQETFQQNEKMLVRLSWQRHDVQHAGVAIMKQSGEYVFGPNTYLDKRQLDPKDRQLEYVVELNLGPGEYFLKAGLFGEDDDEILEFADDGPAFMVEGQNPPSWGGLTKLEHHWQQAGKDLPGRQTDT